MSVRFPLIAGLAVCLLSGCRTDPRTQVYIDNVNAEKRLLEDTLYDLQYDYECSMDEVERLRQELSQRQGGAPAGGTSRIAPRGEGQKETPATPGDALFPDIPDLKPPTVEAGTPERPKPPAGAAPSERKDKPAPPTPGQPEKMDPHELDDLEPPTLDLGDEKSAASLTPEAARPAAETGDRDEPAAVADKSATPAGKPAARWTPRAERPATSPPRRIEVAESPGKPLEDAAQPATGRVSDGPTNSAAASPAAPAQKQALRPQWRPYR